VYEIHRSNAPADDTYTLDELRAPQMDHQVVRPLVDRLYNPKDYAVGQFGHVFWLWAFL
jgi:hypothetical protein